jgi:hypothetical protein
MADEPAPSTQEPAPNNPEAAANWDFSVQSFCDEVSKVMREVGERHEKAEVAAIGYMDRLMILAGGTLTLVFTVISNLGPRLSAMHAVVSHPALIMGCCWLLVLSVIAALLFNSVTIRRQRSNAVQSPLILADIQIKAAILSKNWRADVSGLPSLASIIKVPHTKHSHTATRVARIVAELSIVAAFILLVCFLQGNLRILLAVR